jgi:hypothetical protein
VIYMAEINTSNPNEESGNEIRRMIIDLYLK